MLLTEFFQDAKPGYQNLSQDHSINHTTDMRNTRLTLAQINQLRKMNDQRTVEMQEKLEAIQQQYKEAPQQPAGL